ncbi:Hypothetical predicted protein [Cloeon dipterum]|uniref:Uncharacterized protein n=1 Tax=Cloeon dipterum TaxID=197152 RepID=A0A8S1D6J0_9INSE|nr:Hypothetical predicted protein [Cloeon dipterum]
MKRPSTILFLRGLPDSVRKMMIGREQDDFESLIRIIEKGQQMEKAHQQPAQGNFGPPWAHAGEHPASHQQP